MSFYEFIHETGTMSPLAKFNNAMIDRNYLSVRIPGDGPVSIAISPVKTSTSFQFVANYLKIPETSPQFSYQIEYMDGQVSSVINFDENTYKRYGNIVKASVDLSSSQNVSGISRFKVFITESINLMNYILLPDHLTFKSTSYDPYGNLSSSFDSSLSSVYYEYDGLQRLKVIRNNKGEIINSYEYHTK